MSSDAAMSRIRAAMSVASTQARVVLAQLITELDIDIDGDPVVAKQRLAPVWEAVCREYGLMAATITAEWFDELRAQAGAPGVFRAAVVDIPHETVATSLSMASAPLFDPSMKGEAAKVRLTSNLGSYLYENLKDAGHRVVETNVFRDRSRPVFARVPEGDACVFCRVLASRGAVYTSREAAEYRRSGGSKYHSKTAAHGGGDCQCTVTPLWRGQRFQVSGYDPDALYAEYRTARKAAASPELADITATMRSIETAKRNA